MGVEEEWVEMRGKVRDEIKKTERARQKEERKEESG